MSVTDLIEEAALDYRDWLHYAASSGISQDPYEAYDAAWECLHGRVPAEGCGHGCHRVGVRRVRQT